MILTRDEVIFIHYLYNNVAIRRQNVKLVPQLKNINLRRIARLVRRGYVRKIGDTYVITSDGRWLVEVLRTTRLELKG